MNTELTHRIFAHSSMILSIAILLGALIFLKNMKHNRATLLVYISLLVWFFLGAKDMIYLFGDVWYDKEITNVLMTIDVWIIPLVTYTLLELIQPRWLTIWRAIWMFLPFPVLTLLTIISKGDQTVYFITQLFVLPYSTFFCALTLVMSFKYNKYIRSNYSDTDRIDIRWIRYLILMLYALASLWFVISTNVTWLGDGFYYLSSIVFWSTLTYFTLKQKVVFIPNYMNFKDIFNLNKEDDITLDESQQMLKCYSEIESKLEKAMTVDKLFLEPELSMVDLATQMGTNRTYLSKYINIYKSTPFINYINNFRIDEAVSLLKDNTHKLSILEIADKSGFSSVSTFRRVFKQKYGYSPSDYTKK